MAHALHLLHLSQVWRPDGRLQASLASALQTPAPAPTPRKLKAPSKLRARVEGIVEDSLALLDAWDGDADFEAEPDEGSADAEPSLGWPEFGCAGQQLVAPGAAVDVED